MTLHPTTIVETVDREDGSRANDAVLTVRHVVRLRCGCLRCGCLRCGCLRYECNRPGGGVVDVVRGEHCNPVEIPSPVRANPPPLAVPA